MFREERAIHELVRDESRMNSKIAVMDCIFYPRPQVAAEFDETLGFNGTEVVPAQMAIPRLGFPGDGGHHGWL